ncbi:MAG: hypothetical protein JKY56_07045 [Kofleriaceae bacterium]|nr:hypothetical protein [Kofleriaceae bacterium]
MFKQELPDEHSTSGKEQVPVSKLQVPLKRHGSGGVKQSALLLHPTGVASIGIPASTAKGRESGNTRASIVAPEFASEALAVRQTLSEPQVIPLGQSPSMEQFKFPGRSGLKQPAWEMASEKNIPRATIVDFTAFPLDSGLKCSDK